MSINSESVSHFASFTAEFVAQFLHPTGRSRVPSIIMAMRQMEQHLCNLKLYAKELNRQSMKCNKEESKQKSLVKKAIQKGLMEKARIYGENAIRQKNQGLNFLRLSARVDGVAGRVQAVIANRKVMGSLGGICLAMDQAIRTMNLEAMSTCLEKFESQFESLDVQSSTMENAMGQTTTTLAPVDDVNELLHSVADEAGLDLGLDLPRPRTGTATTDVTAHASEDDLSARLARLRMK